MKALIVAVDDTAKRSDDRRRATIVVVVCTLSSARGCTVDRNRPSTVVEALSTLLSCPRPVVALVNVVDATSELRSAAVSIGTTVALVVAATVAINGRPRAADELNCVCPLKLARNAASPRLEIVICADAVNELRNNVCC